MTDLEMGAGHTLGKLVEEWHHHLKNKLTFFYTARTHYFVSYLTALQKTVTIRLDALKSSRTGRISEIFSRNQERE
jgi:hypothetical protein